MDLTYTRRAATPSAPRHAPGSKRTSPRSRSRPSTRSRRLRGAPRVGASNAERGRLGDGAVAGRVRRPRRRPPRVADLRGGVLPRRRTGARQPERHLPARPDHHGVRHARSRRRATCPKMASSEEVWARAGPSRTPAATWPRSRRPPSEDGDHYVINGQKTWASRGAYAHWLFGMFRTDPGVGASPRAHVRARPARYAGRDGAADREAQRQGGVRGGLLRRRACPVANLLGEEGKGWDGRDGDRGLRARTHAPQPGPLPGTRRGGSSSSIARTEATAHCRPGELRERVAECWMRTPRPTRSTPIRRSRDCSRGGKIGCRSEPQQDLLVRARRRRCTNRARDPRRASARSCFRRRAGGRGRRRLARRLHLLALRSRSTRARTRCSATSSPSGSSSLPRK